jgi:hypothetical protein
VRTEPPSRRQPDLAGSASRHVITTLENSAAAGPPNASVTLEQTGIADAINDRDGRWESARNKMFALDFATQAQQPPTLFIDGVVHRDGYDPPALLAALAR